MSEISGNTQVFGILADPIHHVKTPQGINRIFQAANFDGVMVPFHVEAENLASMVQSLRQMQNLGGFVVTVPHKTAMWALCDELTPVAARVGAVNVVRRMPDGRLSGTMLDGEGFVTGLRQAGIELKGISAYLAGAGGAASAIAYAVAQAGVRRLVIANRTADKAAELIARIQGDFPDVVMEVGTADPSGHDIVINATSLGLREGDALPLNTEGLSAGQTVAEIIMQPAETRLMIEARAKGCRVHAGAAMLGSQLELMAGFMGAILPDQAARITSGCTQK